MTGDLANALDRDLRADQLRFDDLGWLGLWCYVTEAPPGTSIFRRRTEGWDMGDKLAAELLVAVRKLDWRYTAVHFENGANAPTPTPIEYPGRTPRHVTEAIKAWETMTLDEMVRPEVRALLAGDGTGTTVS